MTRRLPTALALVACLLLAAAASAAARSRIHYLHPEAVHVRKASGPRPSISKVSPMQVTIGQKLESGGLVGKHRLKMRKSRVLNRMVLSAHVR